MNINWKRILIAAIVAEIVLFSIVKISQRYAGSTEDIIYYLALFGLMLIGGLWIAHKIESRFVLHGVLVGIVANVLFVIYLLPWILRGQLPGEYWIELFESFAIKIAGSTLGGYIGGKLRKKALA
jgi:putative membrane protein (TIGR04086 family)